MPEQDIELFIALTESKSITGAANRLFTTQSALTKRLQKLEEELGCNLFLRSRRGVTPTPAAESILTELLSIRDSLQKVRSQASSFGGQIAGTMEFGVSVNYAADPEAIYAGLPWGQRQCLRRAKPHNIQKAHRW